MPHTPRSLSTATRLECAYSKHSGGYCREPHYFIGVDQRSFPFHGPIAVCFSADGFRAGLHRNSILRLAPAVSSGAVSDEGARHRQRDRLQRGGLRHRRRGVRRGHAGHLVWRRLCRSGRGDGPYLFLRHGGHLVGAGDIEQGLAGLIVEVP